MDSSLDHLRYPIGKFDSAKNDYSLEELLQFVIQIQTMPGELAKLLNGITPEKLSLSYRPGGWTIQQIVHHLADSHMNAYIRCKLILAEDNPTIKPYDENVWAAEVDYTFNYEASYILLVGLHQRWSLLLLECLKKPELLLRTMFHPESKRTMTLAQVIALYAWHGRQHCAHIRLALGN